MSKRASTVAGHVALVVLWVWIVAPLAQEPQNPTPVPMAVTYQPFPAGMRIIVGANGALIRNSPSTPNSCGDPPHACTLSDSIQPNVYGVILADAPVLDAAGWYWSRITFDAPTPSGIVTGWASAFPPYINSLVPPQMIAGSTFSIAADYSGPVLTNAACNFDGVATPATLQLQAVTQGQQGIILCPIKSAGIGNHKMVIQAFNPAGTASSSEFQFSVTAAPVQSPPQQPQSLRIVPGATGATQTGAKPQPSIPVDITKPQIKK